MDSVQDFVKQVQKKEIDIVEHTHKILEKTKKIDKNYNYFTTISENLALQQAQKLKKDPKGKLAGIAISVKDSICVKNVESRAGSKILQGYIPPFNATVIEKVIKEGAIIIGKTTQDEFGFGTFAVNTDKIPKNPFNKEHTTGGSSGGCAGMTQQAEFPHLSLAESTGGSIAVPASFCGITGLTPTYGLVSRYGLIDYASSLDKIGPMSQNPEDAFFLLDIIKGKDPKDATSTEFTPKEKNKKELKIGIIKEAIEIVPKEIKERINEKIKNKKFISLKETMKYALATYQLIAYAEASTNLARYTGIKYGITENIEGDYNEYFTKIRSKYFQKESKRRIIIGTFARMAGFKDAYFTRAMQTRTLIINEFQRAFQEYDILICPSTIGTAPRFDEIKKLTPLQHTKMDMLTVGPNLAGLPHISINVGSINQLPVGLMAIANHFQEDKLKQFVTEQIMINK